MEKSDFVLFYQLTPAYVILEGRYLTPHELREEANKLQKEAMVSKLAGNHERAVQLYRELLPLVRKLDELEAFPISNGVYPQLIERALELEEECCAQAPANL